MAKRTILFRSKEGTYFLNNRNSLFGPGGRIVRGKKALQPAFVFKGTSRFAGTRTFMRFLQLKAKEKGRKIKF